MILAAPTPWKEALASLRSRELLPTTLSSAQLKQINAELLRRSVFSAKVQNFAFLDRVAEVMGKIVDPTLTGQEQGSYMDRATARLELRTLLQQLGYSPTEDGVTPGTLEDLSSDGRLNLIIDTNVQMEQARAYTIQGQDEAILDAFPVQELVRVEPRIEERKWPGIWFDNGGQFYGGGRMMARKDDEIWLRISEFGNPYPPFRFGSGMGVRDVARREAVDLGVIAASDRVAPLDQADLQPGLQAGVAGLSKQSRDALLAQLGDGFTIDERGVLMEAP